MQLLMQPQSAREEEVAACASSVDPSPLNWERPRATAAAAATGDGRGKRRRRRRANEEKPLRGGGGRTTFFFLQNCGQQKFLSETQNGAVFLAGAYLESRDKGF